MSHLRQAVLSALNTESYVTAIYLAEELVVLNESPYDIYLLAKAYYKSREYRRAIHCMMSRNMLGYLDCQFLVASCLFQMKEYSRCIGFLVFGLNQATVEEDPLLRIVSENTQLQLVSGAFSEPSQFARVGEKSKGTQNTEFTPAAIPPTSKSDTHTQVPYSQEYQYISALYLLVAKSYINLDYPILARKSLVHALRVDQRCFEAFSMLVDNYYLTYDEQLSLISELDFEFKVKFKVTESPSAMEIDGNGESKSKMLQQQHPRNIVSNVSMNLGSVSTPTSTPVVKATSKLNINGIALSESVYSEGEDGGEGDVEKLDLDWLKEKYLKYIEAHNPNVDYTHKEKMPEKEPRSTHKKDGRSTCAHTYTTYDRMLEARQLYGRGQYSECLEVIKGIHSIDPYASEIITLHGATLYQLGDKNGLYKLSHKVAEDNPDDAATAYCVGVYYLLINRLGHARKYFAKASTLDSSHAESCIGFGHTFALKDESDEAMASYRTAAKLFRSLHSPHLFIGMEYSKLGYYPLAISSLNKALELSAGNVSVLNELGVVHFKAGDYETARDTFSQGIDILSSSTPTPHPPPEPEPEHTHRSHDGVSSSSSSSPSQYSSVNPSTNPGASAEHQEQDRIQCSTEVLMGTSMSTKPPVSVFGLSALYISLRMNIGHCFRKLGDLQGAYDCFEECTRIGPKNCGSYASLAYISHLLGNYESAIENYHAALSYDPSHIFSSEMLARALEEVTMNPVKLE